MAGPPKVVHNYASAAEHAPAHGTIDGTDGNGTAPAAPRAQTEGRRGPGGGVRCG